MDNSAVTFYRRRHAWLLNVQLPTVACLISVQSIYVYGWQRCAPPDLMLSTKLSTEFVGDFESLDERCCALVMILKFCALHSCFSTGGVERKAAQNILARPSKTATRGENRFRPASARFRDRDSEAVSTRIRSWTRVLSQRHGICEPQPDQASCSRR